MQHKRLFSAKTAVSASFVLLWSLSTSTWLGAATTAVPGPVDSVEQKFSAKNTDVIVQLFNWPFSKITQELPLLAEAGYGQIHVSPPNLTIATNQWWGRYQPVDYRLIAGPLGTEAQFKEMIDSAHARGIRILVDIVFNHTANPTSTLPPEAAKIREREGPLFTAEDYHDTGCILDYENFFEVRNNRICSGDGDIGLPDLDQDSQRVLSAQREFLKRLSALGVDGFRIDAVKHMEPSYFSQLLGKDITAGKFVYGEVIADQRNYDRDLTPYLESTSMSFYDFPLRATIQGALGFGGSIKTLFSNDLVRNKQAVPAKRSVTFVVNHDIPNNASFRGMILDPKDEELGYAYILGRADGVPYVYSDLGIESAAGLTYDRWKNAHRSGALKRKIQFHNYVYGEPQINVFADDCLLIAKRGTKGFFGINKCGNAQEARVDGLKAGTQFKEVLTDNRGSISGGTFTFELPPRSARMYLLK